MLISGVTGDRQSGKRSFGLNLQHHLGRTTIHFRHLLGSQSFLLLGWPQPLSPISCPPATPVQMALARWMAPQAHQIGGANRAFRQVISSPKTIHNQLALTVFFFFNDTATTEIYTLSLHDALPIFGRRPVRGQTSARAQPARLCRT